MEIRIRLVWVMMALAASLLVCAGRAVLRAHRDLVTLNVRNMDVRKVVRKIEWQTWERIYVAKDVQGKVTLNIRNASLEEALALVGSQVTARSAHVYPVYRDKGALKELQVLIQRDSAALAQAGHWTNYTTGGFGPGGGRWGGFDAPDPHANAVTVSVHEKEASLAAVTLATAARAQVVPEDGLDDKISLQLNGASPAQAIEQFAKTLHASWTEFYSLRAARPDFARNREDDAEAQERRARRMEARLEAMTPEERSRMEELRNLTPEERQARMQARMEDPAVQQRMIDRTLNSIRTSTPEQMVDRKRQRMQMAQTRGEQGSRGGGMRPPMGPQ